MDPQKETPWYAAYPAVKREHVSTLACSDLLRMMHSGAQAGKDFVLVDLRRNDHQGGTIRGSINLPAQSLYASLSTIYNIVKAAKVPMVIWYCGSSRGRGSRAAGWFADLLDENMDQDITSLVLAGGVAGWVKGGQQYVNFMDEYDPEAWGGS